MDDKLYNLIEKFLASGSPCPSSGDFHRRLLSIIEIYNAEKNKPSIGLKMVLPENN